MNEIDITSSAIHPGIRTALSKIVSSKDISACEARQNLDDLESALLELPQLTEDDFQLKEYVSGGMYCREITIPQYGMLTGRVYKFDHVEIMLRGDITILSANGQRKRYRGHNVIEAKAGKRQAGFANEETTWLTVNKVPNIPMDKMLDYTSTLGYEAYNEFHKAVNTFDYQNFLSEIGFTQAKMDDLVNSGEVLDLPEEFDFITVKESKLEGVGLFTSKDIEKGELICPVRIGQDRTIAGRYSNHALHPNSMPCIKGSEFYIIASCDINAGDEITMNYREILKFRASKGDLCQDGLQAH